MFYRELAALLGSGVSLVPALDVILQAPELNQARGRVAAVRDRIREGASLSAAMGEASEQVTAFEQSVIEVGERTGGMNEALNRLASFLEEQGKLREKTDDGPAVPLCGCFAGCDHRWPRAGIHAPHGPASVFRGPGSWNCPC